MKKVLILLPALASVCMAETAAPPTLAGAVIRLAAGVGRGLPDSTEPAQEIRCKSLRQEGAAFLYRQGSNDAQEEPATASADTSVTYLRYEPKGNTADFSCTFLVDMGNNLIPRTLGGKPVTDSSDEALASVPPARIVFTSRKGRTLRGLLFGVESLPYAGTIRAEHIGTPVTITLAP